MLDGGYAFKMNGKSYLLQSRLIQFLFDLAEFSKSINMHVQNSKEGCPICHGAKGISRFKVIYSGDRCKLPFNHYLRNFGQTACCCPPDYYSQDKKDDVKKRKFYGSSLYGSSKKEKTFNEIMNMTKDDKDKYRSTIIRISDATEVQLKKARVAQDMPILAAPFFFNVCDTDNEERILRYLYANDTVNVETIYLHYNEVPVDIWKYALYYEFCDFRRQQSMARKDTTFHKENAILAIANNQHSKGVTGSFYGFLSNHVKLETHVNIDPAHTLAGMFGYIILLWGGQRPSPSDAFNKYCEDAKIFPCMWDSEYKDPNNRGDLYPWQISTASQNKIDAFLCSLHIPLGTSQHFEVKTIFTYSGLLKFSVKLKLITALMPVIVLWSGMALPYKAFFTMFSGDIVNLLSPVHDLSKVDELTNRLIETVCIYQGLFPPSEHCMVVHHLMHLAAPIATHGLVSNFSTIGGERALSSIKRFAKKGGANLETSLFHRLNEDHRFKSKSIFDFSVKGKKLFSSSFPKMFDSFREYVTVQSTENENCRSIEYNPFCMKIPSPFEYKKKKFQDSSGGMTNLEGNYFLDTLIHEIVKQTEGKADAEAKSKLFWLYSKYLEKKHLAQYKTIADHVKMSSATHSFYHFISLLRNIERIERGEILNILVEDEELKDSRPVGYVQDREFLQKIKDEEGGWFTFNANSKDDYQGEYYLLTNLSKYLQYRNSHRMNTKCIIYGGAFHGRGFKYRETKKADKKMNDNHNLMESWCLSNYSSSWIQYRHNGIKYGKINIDDHEVYGTKTRDNSSFALMNFCFQLILPSEKILHGVKIASITTINHSYKPVWKAKGDNNKTPFPHTSLSSQIPYVTIDNTSVGNRTPKSRIFVPFTDIYASNIATIGVDEDHKPFRNARNDLSKKSFNILKKEFSQKNTNEIKELWLIMMNPERLSIEYHPSNNEMYNLI